MNSAESIATKQFDALFVAQLLFASWENCNIPGAVRQTSSIFPVKPGPSRRNGRILITGFPGRAVHARDKKTRKLSAHVTDKVHPGTALLRLELGVAFGRSLGVVFAHDPPAMVNQKCQFP